MGSCISKCKPKKTFKQDCNHVHDKLVISQDPIVSSIPSMEKTLPTQKKTLSPVLSSSSTASFSSFSCSANSKFTLDSSIPSSSSSSSSCSSSTLIAKDQSFSNEFLISCMKENPQVIGLNSMIKERNTANKIHPQNFQVLSPKKRARASSPNLVQQKSLRKDRNFSCSTPNRSLRSPSPSRRFNGAKNNRSFIADGVTNESVSRRQSISRCSLVNSVSSGAKRESFRAASPNRELTINRNVLVRKRGTFCQEIGAKIESTVGVGDVQKMDVLMEDINNPLIALDCFIFL